MAITHIVGVRDSFCSDVSVATEANGAAGTVVFMAAAVDLCTVPMAVGNAWAAPSGGSMTANAFPGPGTVTVAGTTDIFEIRDAVGTLVLTGSVTGVGSGGDIEITNPVLEVNDQINVTALTYTAAP